MHLDNSTMRLVYVRNPKSVSSVSGRGLTKCVLENALILTGFRPEKPAYTLSAATKDATANHYTH